jgi:signal transduction histidine kinase
MRRQLGIDPEDAFVAGLLHDLGKVALDTVFPKAYDRIVAQTNHSRGVIADSERAVLGADHTVAGRRLAERWRLPRAFQEAIWLHHLAAEALPSTVKSPGLIGVVQLADTVAREQRIGYSGNHSFYEHSPRLAARLGLAEPDLQQVIQPLAQDVSQHATALGLDGETAAEVYVKAMTQANSELGRLNIELRTSNQRLAAGARYFKAISRFEAMLGDWSDPSAVVQALAESASSALQRPRLVAFGLRDQHNAVDLSWIGESEEQRGHQTHPFPPELAAWLADTSHEFESFVVHAPAPIRALVAPQLGREAAGTVWLLPIFHDGRIAGGLAYASTVDERARLASEADDLRSFLASLGLALGRANAAAAARRLSEDLAETNRRLQQMQAELLRSRTLSMIAEMAAGAGHELNSPLTVISGRAQMLAGQLDDPEVQRALRTISDKAHECSGIVSELMDFARPRPAKMADVDLIALLSEVREEVLQRSTLRPGQLRLDADPAARPTTAAPHAISLMVQVDPAQIKQVFRELINNAVDALGDDADGRIEISLKEALQPNAIEVIVRDTGCGMTPAVLQRAFDPFFSYHKAGRGAGSGCRGPTAWSNHTAAASGSRASRTRARSRTSCCRGRSPRGVSGRWGTGGGRYAAIRFSGSATMTMLAPAASRSFTLIWFLDFSR